MLTRDHHAAHMAVVRDKTGPQNVLAEAKLLRVLQLAGASYPTEAVVPAGLAEARSKDSRALTEILFLESGAIDSKNGRRNAIRDRLNLEPWARARQQLRERGSRKHGT